MMPREMSPLRRAGGIVVGSSPRSVYVTEESGDGRLATEVSKPIGGEDLCIRLGSGS